jgi:RimJ/RimL family protein N-acetyltransferase
MLRALELGDMEHIREWRNDNLSILRTPFALTKEQQEDWYKNEICDRRSRSRFWAICDECGQLIGYGGIENIQWENSIGEISLLISKKYQGKGLGYKAAMDILHEAFSNMNLRTVFAECYENNKSVKFWDKVFNGCYQTKLPCKKYHSGIYFDSIYYSCSKDDI